MDIEKLCFVRKYNCHEIFKLSKLETGSLQLLKPSFNGIKYLKTEFSDIKRAELGETGTK